MQEIDNTTLNNILYELLIYAEWQQEPEIQIKGNENKNDGNEKGILSKFLGPFASQLCPPLLVQQLNNLQMPWAFAIGGSGAVIAVLQDTSLEIRTSRDEFGTIIGKTQVIKDTYPQWRRLLWSPDCTMLAFAHSNGQLDFYDLIGAHMFTIDKMVQTPSPNGKQDYRYAIAGMAFTDARVKNTQCSYAAVASDIAAKVNSDSFGAYENFPNVSSFSPSNDFSETLSLFELLPESCLNLRYSPSEGFQARRDQFSMSNCYPHGITSVVYNRTDNILIACGRSQKLTFIQGTTEASQMGISAWRLLSEYPHYKLALSMDENKVESKKSWKDILSQYNFYQSSKDDFIFKMSISPSGKLLASIHVSGAVSLWDLPSLRLKKHWPLNLQPNYNDVNPQHCEPGVKKNGDFQLSDVFHSHVIDINWWSEDSLIIVRRCGAVTVSSIHSLQNLLGVSPEWFEPSPAVTSFCDRGFLVIECENRLKSKKRDTEDSLSDEESSDDEEPSIFTYSYEMAQRALYFITDLDRFQPPRKKTKMSTKVYRLLCLKSTTPEELYVRKINNEEYGEALALAQTYNLDTDLVYQRQWRKMPATVETIHDYLSKIKKRSWVLHECLERVPENFEAAKELLDYGMRGTDVKALVAIGRGEDQGRFILSSFYDEFDDEYMDHFAYDINYDAGEIYEMRRIKQQKKRAEFLKEVNFTKLNLEQKQLCQCRLKLLNYVDRLTTYEIILGGAVAAQQHFDPKFFKQFRSQCGLEATIQFAFHSNWEAVATLFTYMGTETLPHRLGILSNFPETTSPSDYQSLLPLYNDLDMVFYPWHEQKLRDPDWCENEFDKIVIPEEYIEEFYEKNKGLLKYRNYSLSSEVVTEWFIERAQQVEARSGLVDNALQLLKLGMQRNIQGLEKLYDDLKTLEILIYDCGIKKDLNLSDFQKLSDSEKVKLIMSTTPKENFIAHLYSWLVPYLNQCEKYSSGSAKPLLKNYILYMSSNDLSYCKMFMESLKSETCSILCEFDDMVFLGLDCVYACERTDELKNAAAIYEILLTLPDYFNKTYRKLCSLPSTVADLKKHIRVAEILEKNNFAVTLSMVQSLSNNMLEVKKVLVKLTRMASHRIPVLDEEEWTNLLSDILEMHKVLFKCVTYEDCYEIVLHSLLCSGKNENITFAGKMMECNNKKKREKNFIGPASFKLPFVKSVELVLVASQEYFNSAADASDSCMSLAKSCLNLIEDVPSSIEEEFDLISSLSLLQELGVVILPLQVRLCENRMTIVQEALQKKAKNYKKSAKIMKLAFLLRAGTSNNHEREGKVWTLLGDHAFQVKDYKECYSSCKRIMEGGYEEGWLVCYTLGQCNEFDDVSARKSLMSFALAYCAEDLIETILKTKSELELQVLQERVKFLVGDLPAHFPSADSEDGEVRQTDEDSKAVNTILKQSGRTLKVLHSTTHTAAKVVLTSVKSAQFWKDAVNWVQPPGLLWGSSPDVKEDGNAALTKQGVCAFYSGLIENSHISLIEANYERYAGPDLHQQLEISSSILRASLIQDALKNESSASSIENSVLLDVAKAYLPEDMTYALSVLLSLKKADEAEVLFSSLPSSPIVIQAASLYYAIKIYISLNMSPFPEDTTEGMDPNSLIEKVLAMRSSEPPLAANKESIRYWELLKKYNKMLYDFIQAEILHSIGGGVDATRFANDDEYKKDTILGISMTLDDSVFQTAITLANHYHISLWDLYMTHLEYLFSESSVSSAVLTERIERFKLSEKLMDQKKAFEVRLRNNIYPGIDGKDHEKLTTCFSLLEDCGDNEDDLKLQPSVHKNLLKKFKAAMANIDYKKLMCSETSSSYLMSLLNESSVHVFAKAATNIPKQGEVFYEPSNIYCLWTQKEFFEGNSSTTKVPSNKTEWILRFKSCSDMLQRLNPSDVILFVDAVIFSEKALENMDLDCRSDIVKQVIKLCRAKSSKHKSNVLLSNEWNDAVVTLTSYQSHLQRLEDETLVQLRECFDPKIKNYCKEFDLSKSAINKLQDLLTEIVLEGPDLELLKTFLSCCPADIGWEPADAYIEAINKILKQLKQSQNLGIGNSPSLIHTVEAILGDISKEKEELMIEDIAAKMLNEFCQDSDVSVSVRLNILQLLEKTDCLSPEYGDLLLLYRTQAVVSSMFPDVVISDEEIKEEFQRRLLFDNLLSLCRNIEHFQSLSKLLIHWPSFTLTEKREPKDDEWTKLMCKLIDLNSIDSLAVAVSILEKALSYPSFEKECFQLVFEKIKEQRKILYVLKSALKTKYSDIHEEAMNELKVTLQISEEDYDNELLDLILLRSLTTQIISTGLYKPVVEFLLHGQDDIVQDNYKSIDTIVKELCEAGYESEAGSLLLIHKSIHSSLSTYSSAMSVLQRWSSVSKS
nr:neuroblastoma-amplified sequence [Parasteatoda tepidariorum]